MRKDGKYAPSRERGDPVNYEVGLCEFRYMSEDLSDALMDSHLVVSYRVKLRGKKAYLQPIMDIPANTTMYDGQSVWISMMDILTLRKQTGAGTWLS